MVWAFGVLVFLVFAVISVVVTVAGWIHAVISEPLITVFKLVRGVAVAWIMLWLLLLVIFTCMGKYYMPSWFLWLLIGGGFLVAVVGEGMVQFLTERKVRKQIRRRAREEVLARLEAEEEARRQVQEAEWEYAESSSRRIVDTTAVPPVQEDTK